MSQRPSRRVPRCFTVEMLLFPFLPMWILDVHIDIIIRYDTIRYDSRV